MAKLKANKKKRWSEVEEIKQLESWIEYGKPDSGWNPLSINEDSSPPPYAYAGCKKFHELPLSQKTKDGLDESKYVITTDVQLASLPHSLCGRDVIAAAKTGSGKTLAFIIPVLEKLYRSRWGPQDGVGSIIITPTRELADQIFNVLRTVGKHHTFSAGLLIGGRKDVEFEKEHVNNLNILVCTPGRLLQHMDETLNFDCSQLQILVLDEADRILDVGFKAALNAILSQLPKNRQTLLFSATQAKSVQDLVRLSMKEPEYFNVHQESATATPSNLRQTAIIVPLELKLEVLWSFIKAHLNSKILVFLSTCKQVKFVFKAFKTMQPGIPLKCLHGKMKQKKRMAIYSEFCETRSVLFSTDVVSRGLDFNKAVDWVVQVDCPDDVASYIHRVGRTARYHSRGRSVLFLIPSEEEMLKKLQSAKIPLQLIKAYPKRLEFVSRRVAALLVQDPLMQVLAQKAFTTYLRSIHKQKDKEVFDVSKLPIEIFSASLGLPMTPKVRFLNYKDRFKKVPEDFPPNHVTTIQKCIVKSSKRKTDPEIVKEELENEFLLVKERPMDSGENGAENETAVPATRILRKKKLKINLHRPVGTRVVFDDEGNTLPPLAAISNMKSGNDLLQPDEVKERYKRLREEMKQRDVEDKHLLRQRLQEKHSKMRMKLRRERTGEKNHEDDTFALDGRKTGSRSIKRSKIHFDNDNDNDSISLAEQEALALKLLSSMH